MAMGLMIQTSSTGLDSSKRNVTNMKETLQVVPTTRQIQLNDRSILELKFVPEGGGENPTLWWAAQRFMQGAKRFQELELLLPKVLQQWNSYPRVSRNVRTGQLTVSLVGNDFLHAQSEAAALASESLLHFRAALDRAVYQLSWKNTGNRPKGTAFPFCNRSDKWRKRVHTDLKGVADKYVSRIAQLQPFNGVSWTTQLGLLSNRDKHDQQVQIASVYSCQVDMKQEYPDPTRSDLKILQVTNAQVAFVFVPPDRKIDTKNPDIATDVLIDIMRGIVDFLNPLLEEDHVHPIQVVQTTNPD
ncbi:hypothetical protein [Bifidobacterium mongoliense]|uniref:hypothetical protein n=1 Tax=Bifidobacterium mongoliense TaxID=518643 RepID=UPI0030EE68BF